MHTRKPAYISACLTGLNQSRYLPLTMKSAYELADELIYVDLGSTDGSINVASEFDAKIIKGEGGLTVEEARDTAKKHSNGKWILDLDPGHELVVHDLETVKSIIYEAGSDAFYLPEYSLVNPADFLYQPLLYRNNGKTSYERIFRCSPSMAPSNSVSHNISTALMEYVTVCHREKKLRDEQVNEIINQLEQVVLLEPKNARHHHYLAFYYYLLHNDEKAGHHVREGINLLAGDDVDTLLNMREASGLFGYYTRSLVNDRKVLDRTIQSLLDLHEKIHPNTQFTSNLAVLLHRAGRHHEAANLFKEALNQVFNPTWTTLSFYENYINPLYHFLDFIREMKSEMDLLKIVLNVQTLSTKNNMNIRKFFSFLNDHHPDFLNLIDGVLKRKMSVLGIG